MLAGPRPQEVSAASAPERVLVSLLSLGAVAVLLVFRGADDNRLTSWQWVFAAEPPLRLYALVAAGLVLALAAARLPGPRRPAALLFLAAYAAGACTWGAPEVVVDAARYFTQAKHLEVYGLRAFLAGWGRSIPAWTDLPLVPLLDGAVLRAFGESRVYLQVLGTALFAGTVVATQRLGAMLWDEEVGFLAGALLLAMPYLLAQVPLTLVDVPTMFFLTLAMWAVVAAVRRGGTARVALAALAVAAALLAKYSTWLLLSGIAVVAAAVPGPGERRSPRAVAAVALAAAALVGGAILLRRDVFAAQLALLRDYQAPGLGRWSEGFGSTFLFQIHPFVTAAALASVAIAIRRRDARWAVAAWPVALLLVLHVQRSRYWIPALPMLALMAAHGLQALRSREARRLVAACAVATSLVVALHGYVPFLERTSASNLAAAGAYLAGVEEARVEVFTPAAPGAEVNPAVAVPLLDLFTSKAIVQPDPLPARPTGGRIDTSPLRFTWEYVRPRYYAGEADGPDAAVAIVSDDLDRPLPEPVRSRVAGMRLARVFAADEGIFGYRTLVAVYRRSGGTLGPLRLRQGDLATPRSPRSLEIRTRGEAELDCGGPLGGRGSLIRLPLRSPPDSQALLNKPRLTSSRSASSRSCLASSCDRYESR